MNSVTTPTTPIVEKLLSYKQAGELLGVTERTVWTLVADGELPAVRFGRSAGIDPTDLRAYIDRCKTTSRPESKVHKVAQGGMAWREAMTRAEKHVKAHDGAFPSVKRLAEIVGCSRPTIDKAVARSAYLKARKAEAKSKQSGGAESTAQRPRNAGDFIKGTMPGKEVRTMAVSTDPPKLNTTGYIAGKLGVPLHRVTYIIRSRGIQPAAFAGQLRLYNREAVAIIRHELNAIDARRECPERKSAS